MFAEYKNGPLAPKMLQQTQIEKERKKEKIWLLK